MKKGRELRKRQVPDYDSLLAAYHHLEAAHIRLKKRHRELTEKVSELIRLRYEEKGCAAECSAKQGKKVSAGKVVWSGQRANPPVLSKAARAYAKKLEGDRELAIEFLKRAGIIERPGKLARPYR